MTQRSLCAQVTSVHVARDVRIFGKIARSLAAAGYDVVVIHPEGELPAEAGVRFSGLGLRGGRLRRLLFGGFRPFRRARTLGARVFHFHDPELIPWGILWQAFGGIAIYDVQEDVPRGVAIKTWMPWILRRPLSIAVRIAEWCAGMVCAAIVPAHSQYSLPIAVAVSWTSGIPVIYDARELETERNGTRGLRQRVDRILEHLLIRHCSAVLRVSDSIADWYAHAYGIPRPAVVRNIPDIRVQPREPGSRVLRERFGVGEDAVLFLYQGALAPGPRIEQLLRVFATARPDRHLVLMGYGVLEPAIRAAAATYPNIHFQPAVPSSEVLRYTASADVGICGGENVCLSYYYSLPNKLFEYLLSGLPFLVPDWPEMRRIVDADGCGWVVGESDAEWQVRVDGLTRDEIATASSAAEAAAPHYSWAREEQVRLDVYRRVL